MKQPHGAGATRRHARERGYALLALLLTVTLIAITMTAIAPSIALQLKRDREEELIHRGVQYSRAVRRFAKQTGRFPTQLDELYEGREGQRYLRRLYKDPITGGDFKRVYTSDIASAAAKANASPLTGGEQENTAAGSSPSDSNSGLTDNHAPGEIIFGVVSKSKEHTIREFNHQNYYNQWLFVYDPHYDTGQQIKGPTSFQMSASPQAQPEAATGPQTPSSESQPPSPPPQ